MWCVYSERDTSSWRATTPGEQSSGQFPTGPSLSLGPHGLSSDVLLYVAPGDPLVWPQLFRGHRCAAAGPGSPEARVGYICPAGFLTPDCAGRSSVLALLARLCPQLPSPGEVENPRHLGREVACPGAAT